MNDLSFDLGAISTPTVSAPPCPTWPTTYPHPLRMQQFFSGICDAIAGGPTLANAQLTFSPAQVAKWKTLAPNCFRHYFGFTEVWPNAGDPAVDPAAYQAIRYVAQTMLAAGINYILNPHDDVGTVNNGLHANTSGYNWAWYVAAITNLMAQLAADIPLFTPDRVMVELVNELGLHVADGTRSMATYNAFLASVIPSLRAALPSTTFIVDTYPTGTETGYTMGGVELALPADADLAVSAHCYHPTAFVWQGTGGSGAGGNLYIAGMPWPYTKTQALAYLSTYNAGGDVGTGVPGLDSQVSDWAANGTNYIDKDGFTSAAIANGLTGLLAYCQSNGRVLRIDEYGASGYASTTFPMPAASANAYETAFTAFCDTLNLPRCYFIAQLLTTDPTLQSPGTNSFVSSRVSANTRRMPRSLAPFAPTPLSILGPSKLLAWYDPTDLSTLFQDSALTVPVASPSDPCGGARDKSVAGAFPLFQATAGHRPTWLLDGVGTLNFDGIDDFLQSANGQTFAQPMTIWCVMKLPSISSNFHDTVWDGQTSNRIVYGEGSPTYNQLFVTGGGALNYAGGQIADNRYEAVCAVYNGASSQLYQNNVLRASGTLATTAATLATLGANADGTRACNVRIQQWFAYNGVAKQAQLDAVHAMLVANHAL